MQHLQNHPATQSAHSVESVHWKATETCDNPDVESAILLRGLVLPAFEYATNWAQLVDALGSIGFGLAIKQGRLTLTDADSGTSICTARFLGKTLAEMSAKLGKPVIRAHPSCDGSGVLVLNA